MVTSPDEKVDASEVMGGSSLCGNDDVKNIHPHTGDPLTRTFQLPEASTMTTDGKASGVCQTWRIVSTE